MIRNLAIPSKWILVACLALAVCVPLHAARAAHADMVLYSFAGGNDGQLPHAGLIMDSAGNLYGTTEEGGGLHCGGSCGTVFKLAPDGTETVLHSFTGIDDGNVLVSGLIEDGAGDFYGTTIFGGTDGYGTVFKLAPDGTETVLYSFQGGSDGAFLQAGVIRDSVGDLYGTTSEGGTDGYGTVFRLAPDGTKTVLYSFMGGSDGAFPLAGLIRVGHNLYGTTKAGGAYGSGTIFELAPHHTETVLYSFMDGSDGAFPQAGVIRDRAGNLYGTTSQGGTHGAGTVFKLAPDGTETVLHSFKGGGDGQVPYAGLMMGANGYLYGTTVRGGTYRKGTVFKIKK